MPIAQYKRYFTDHVRGSPAAVFHNGDIYPNAYDTVRAVTYSKTDAAVTVADRLLPLGESHRLDRFLYWVVSTWPFGKAVRQHVVDPILFRGEPVTWRLHVFPRESRLTDRREVDRRVTMPKLCR